jgi:hypothetical protein
MLPSTPGDLRRFILPPGEARSLSAIITRLPAERRTLRIPDQEPVPSAHDHASSSLRVTAEDPAEVAEIIAEFTAVAAMESTSRD